MAVTDLKPGDFATAPNLMPLSMLRRRQIAALAWTWVAMLALGIMFLGTFVIAFLASVKNDPLESPFRFIFPQVSPSAWFQAADLGAQAGGGSLWGGFSPEADVTFFVTYAAEDAVEDPEVEVPRRVPGSGVAAAITTEFASDYAQLELVSRQDFRVPDPETGAADAWAAATFTYRITYRAVEGEPSPTVKTLPFTATVPARTVLLDSSLPVTQMERRGRTASWDNIGPGALGLIFDNYRRLFNEVVDLGSGAKLMPYWMLTSFLIGVGRVIMIVTLASLAGYALARMKFRGNGLIFGLVIFSMTIPAQVTFISNYLVIRDIGLLGTVWGVVIVLTFSGHVLLMKQFFEGFPKDLEEAATMDGASRLRTLWSVVLPNARPALITNAIMAFQGAWNDFFWPFILITSPPQNLSIQVGLSGLRQAYGAGEGDWGLVLSGGFISIVPMVIMFIIFQRYIVSTNVTEGIK
jgi:multiple sugar transport system permease protein